MKTTLLIISLFLFGNFNLITQENQINLTDDEYAILSSILGDSSVIVNETIPMKIVTGNKEKNLTKARGGVLDIFHLREIMPEISDEAVNDFNAKNEKGHSLESLFTLNDKYILIERGEAFEIHTSRREELLKKWEIFGQKYPKSDGFVRFSRVGFSSDNKQAIIYFTRYCGVTCASGEFLFFIKEKDKWIKKGKSLLWSS